MIPIEKERSTFGGLIRSKRELCLNTKVCTETFCRKIKTNGETSILWGMQTFLDTGEKIDTKPLGVFIISTSKKGSLY